MKQLFSRYPHLIPIVVGVLSAPAYFFAYQSNPSLHFGIGRWDQSFLVDEEAFYPPVRMEGPIRHPDGSVEVRDFVGRLTKRDASFRVPYHGLRSPLELHLRCHRFGLQGTVSLEVNGYRLEDFVFTESSYPWAGIQAVIPEQVAAVGPLRMHLLTTGGETPPTHLPQDLGVGVDWIEVSPMSEGVILLPTKREWLSFFLLLLSAYVLGRFLEISSIRTAVLLVALSALVSIAQIVYPVMTSKILGVSWLIVLGCVVLTWIAEIINAIFPTGARRGARPAGKKT